MLQYQTNRRLSEFSTFGIGGPIQWLALAQTIEEMEEGIAFARDQNLPFLVLGKGSNCLFSDHGFDGLVLLNQIDHCSWNGAKISVGAGYSFSLLGAQSAKRGFSGLEFACGIPASVGGAVYMNAGANGKETAESLISVLYLHADGSKKLYEKSELQFRYRFSSFQRMEGAILAAEFALTEQSQARKTQLAIIEQRIKTQPLKEKSAGCAFRNPGQGMGAGALIDRCGLKGHKIGGAKISEVHANFIVNEGKATARDVLELVERIQSEVWQKTGVQLELELKVIGAHDG